jgi:hypothetical protein
MHALSQWGLTPKIRRLVDGHVIHMALHRAKQVMVQMWYMDGLIYHKQEHPPGVWVILSHRSGNSEIISTSKSGVVRLHNNGMVVV